jgi:isopenicillin N synthase-like dioxygenase
MRSPRRQRGSYSGSMAEIPEVDIAPLLSGDDGAAQQVGRQIDAACTEMGFFYLVGHRVDPDLVSDLDLLARQFFARSPSEKDEIAMARAGRTWRGWFPIGAELTSGIPDLKEGIYFGSELGTDHPRVIAQTPMHGANLFPAEPEELGPVVLEYIDQMTLLAQSVLSGISMGLGLSRTWFSDNLTGDPLVLFRIFRYPPVPEPHSPEPHSPEGELPAPAEKHEEGWSVGEHTDYGLLTIVAQDDSGGLQIETPEGWIDVPPRPGAFVCNLGDMLERLTGGRYRSTPHRVRNTGTGDRLSFPFFLDPSWDATVDSLPIVQRPSEEEARRRWDHTSVHGFEGTYGDYILAKVGKVFPDLAAREI